MELSFSDGFYIVTVFVCLESFSAYYRFGIDENWDGQ